MSIASRIEAIEQHLTDDYNVLEIAGADLTNVNKNILNLKSTWQERLLYFMNNGTDVVWNNWDKVIGEGTTLTLNNTLDGKMKIVLKGNTSQEGTPTPETPQDIHVVSGDNSIVVCGKNLAPTDWASDFVSAVNNTDLAKIETKDGRNCLMYVQNAGYGDYPNKNLTLGMTFKENTQYTVSFDIYKINSTARTVGIRYTDGSYTTPSNLNATDTWEHQSVTSTAGKTIDYICPYYTAGNTYIDIDTWQIEEGTTATTYEAYKGASYPINLGDIELCKIGDYQDSIKKSTGKNLFDKNNANILNAYLNVDNGKITNSNPNRTLYIPCNSNTTYTLTKYASPYVRQIGYTTELPANNVNFYGKVDIPANETTGTITTGENAKYLVCRIMHTNQDTITQQQMLDSIQIEKGSSATSYEPYGNGDWYLEKKIGKVVLDGTNNPISSVSSSSGGVYYAILTKSIDTFLAVPPMSNRYKGGNPGVVAGRIYIATAKNLVMCDTGTSLTTKALWNTWLETNNVVIYYVLSTPTYTEITDSTLLSQLEALKKARSYDGQTNITQTNNDLPFIINATALKEME